MSRLTELDGVEAWVAWSSNGDVAFTNSNHEESAIYVMNGTEDIPTRIIEGVGYVTELSWSPDNSNITFLANEDTGDSNVYAVGSDGNELRQLTYSKQPVTGYAWSPDGSMLAYFVNMEGIYLKKFTDGANSDAISQDRSITQLTTEAFDSWLIPAWSPDSTRIAFNSYRDGTQHIYVVTIDFEQTLRITNSQHGDYFPVWSSN